MSAINRLLSRRDRSRHSHSTHGKEDPKDHSGPLNGLFIDDHAKRGSPDKEEEKKIKAVAHRLAKTGITTFKDLDISYVLNSEYSKGDADKAYELMILLEDSEAGIINPYDEDIKLLGAVNRGAVTCYLDALLFAMFARLGSFEAMLYKNFEDAPRKRLATLLRLWVNTLRAGKLITIDITKQIQLQLAKCGWTEAAQLCQQDASEAFTFITETLALPLLTLKMDIFHTGREDVSDDHKFVNERLLELAVPEANDGQPVTLEECLELFFNNKIEVRRYLDSLERRNTLDSIPSRASISSVKGHSTHVEVAEIEDGQPSSPTVQNTSQTPMPISPSRPTQRIRAPSIIKESYIDEKSALRDGSDNVNEEKGRQRRVKKEVMMPAWQFFSLIPWYTNNLPSNDAQVAAHFSKARPILGICLKRYTFTSNGHAVKRTTHVDIPLDIGLPHFIQDDKMAEDGPAFGNFKLSLQSVVCHQGNSVGSGHYISIVRSPSPMAHGEDGWMRFDDLAAERVSPINVERFLKESKEQTPYLLFYQVIPIEGDPDHIRDGKSPTRNGNLPPPSYSDSTTSGDTKVDSGISDMALSAHSSSIQDRSVVEAIRRSLDYSDRLSVETFPAEDQRSGRSSWASDRRPPSVVFSEAGSQSTPQIALDHADRVFAGRRGSKPATDMHGPNTLTASRRDSNVSTSKVSSSSKSRPTSSSGDKRISRSLSRLAGRLSRDKLNNTIAITASPSLQVGEYPDMPQQQGLAPPHQQNQHQQLHPVTYQQQHQEQHQHRAQSSSVPPSLTPAEEAGKGNERGRLKKEARDHGKGKATHNHLTKAGRRAEKPERECTIM